MDEQVRNLAERLLEMGFDDLPEREQRIISRVAKRLHISRNVHAEFDEQLTFGERLADRFAAFGGSWTFIIISLVALTAWIIINSWLLVHAAESFDPYPYVFLNLILSMLAALQAPIIMMSQNRQATKDRLVAAHDYEVNLKAELDIMRLHEKLDQMRAEQVTELLRTQREQLQILTSLANLQRR